MKCLCVSVYRNIWFYLKLWFSEQKITMQLHVELHLNLLFIWFYYAAMLDYKFTSYWMYCGFDIRNAVILETCRHNDVLLL